MKKLFFLIIALSSFFACMHPRQIAIFQDELSEYDFSSFEESNSGRSPASSLSLVDEKKEYLKMLLKEMDQKAQTDILRQFIRYEFSWSVYTKDKKSGKEASILQSPCEGAFRPRVKKDYAFAHFECEKNLESSFFQIVPQNSKLILEKLIAGKILVGPNFTFKNLSDESSSPLKIPFPTGLYALGTKVSIKKNFNPLPLDVSQEFTLTLSDLKIRKSPLHDSLRDIFFIFEMNPKDQEKILTAEKRPSNTFYPAQITGLLSLNLGLPSFIMPTYREDIIEISHGGEIKEYSTMAFQKNVKNSYNTRVKNF